jgi:hypothetical protein
MFSGPCLARLARVMVPILLFCHRWLVLGSRVCEGRRPWASRRTGYQVFARDEKKPARHGKRRGGVCKAVCAEHA